MKTEHPMPIGDHRVHLSRLFTCRAPLRPWQPDERRADKRNANDD